MIIQDLIEKLDQLLGNSITEAELKKRPDLLEIAALAISRNVNSLTQITAVLNQILDAGYTSESILERPDLLKLGLLAIQTASVSFSDLSQIAVLVNTFLDTDYDADDIRENPSLLNLGVLLFEENGIPLTQSEIIEQGCWVASLVYIFARRQPSVIPPELMAIAPTARTTNTLVEGDRWRDIGSAVEYSFDGRGWQSNVPVNLLVFSNIRAKIL